MPTFLGKTFNTYFKNLLGMIQSGNTGVDATKREIQDGNGNNTSISLSTNHLRVKPQASNSTTTLDVQNLDGSKILAVNTTDSVVKCGSSQINALTQYQYFQTSRIVPVAGSHMGIPLGGEVFLSNPAEIAFGTGANPDTTFDVSAESGSTMNVPNLYWYLPDAITVVAVDELVGGSSVSVANNLNFQLYSYVLDTSSNHGDLSDGTLVAGTVGATGDFVTDVHEDAVKYQSLANVPTDVAAGRVIIATVESSSINNFSVNMVVKYHIQ